MPNLEIWISRHSTFISLKLKMTYYMFASHTQERDLQQCLVYTRGVSCLFEKKRKFRYHVTHIFLVILGNS